MKWEIITSSAQFEAAVKPWSGLIACDTETYGQRWATDKRLLGVSFSPEHTGGGLDGVYIPVNVFSDGKWESPNPTTFPYEIQHYLTSQELVGHNFTYDKWWIENQLAVHSTTWIADTRLMWHLSAAPSGPRPYGLKDAMVELLGWGSNNTKDLEAQVKARGGNLKKGDHYMADMPILAKYAVLDTFATMQVYKKLRSFFETNDYWGMLRKMMEYNLLLDENTVRGIIVDVGGLKKAHTRLLNVKEASKKRFLKELSYEISEIERDWADRRIAEYKREYNKTRYANHPEEWKRFNLNSDKDKRELFFDKLDFPVASRTPSGLPSCDEDSVKWNNHPSMGAYLKYEKANTLSTNFSGPYLDSVVDNRIHPGFNICGTVSYRLSGFKPYLLNAPFDEKNILKHFKCDPGYVGIHADLAAIEPTITAHYSEDPALLKVFKDGLGDIYLDLALTLFPNDKELQEGYDPNIPISKAVKVRFERQRKVAKVIQLAVQYTGTGHTVAKNLTKDGIPTSVETAEGYVRAYWRKFQAVSAFNQRLFDLNREQGHLRNVIGRIIQVPHPDYKDLPNRFIQSSAHDVLIIWRIEIERLFKEAGIDIKPVLVDCHDSTSNQVLCEYAEKGMQLYKEALNNVNKELGLCVSIRAEYKTFHSLAGLKGAE